MELPDIVKETEFLAALSGVIVGFFLTVGGDGIRFWCRRKAKRNMLSDELTLISEDAVSALKQYVKNDEIPIGSKQSPIFINPELNEILSDNLLHLESGLSVEKRRCIRTIANYHPMIKDQVEKLNKSVLNVEPKIKWESYNKNLCHYYAYIIYNCDEYFGLIRKKSLPALNAETFLSENEIVLDAVERKLGLEIPRDR